MIEFMRFHPVKKVKSLIGFCSFKYNKIGFTEIPVHKILLPTSKERVVRLLYPEAIKPNSEMQQEIDREISAYISANYREVLNAKI